MARDLQNLLPAAWYNLWSKKPRKLNFVYERVTDVDTLRHGESVQFGYEFT
jgi:hypothetical protein